MRIKLLMVAFCCAAVVVGVVRADTVFSETFESGTLGQFQSVGSGAGSGWTASSASAHGGTYSAFALDVGATSDHSLVSAAMAVPAAGPVTLRFWHRVNLEVYQGQACDAGVLEVSVDNGPFVDVMQVGTFSEGGYYYADVSASCSSNPLFGRPVWSGDSGGWFETVVAMSASTYGKSIRVALRLGTDVSTPDEGWYVDDVALEGPSPTAVTVTSFTATRDARGVVLRWRVGSDAKFLGFALERNGARLSKRLIATQAGAAGAHYRFVDSGADRGKLYRYRLHGVRSDGRRMVLAVATVR